MRIFITGIAGFLGSHLADAMLADGHEVIGIDNLFGGDLDNIPEGAEFHELDCNETEALKELMRGCNVVYHCAATAHEGLSVFSPAFITQNIVGASVSVFSAAVSNRVDRIVFCSSMARYGAITPPFLEFMTPEPQDPYGIGKLCAEKMLANICTTHGVEYTIAVPHNIIGPRQKYDDPFRNVASIMMNMMLQGRSPVIYGDGTQKRCFSYITDCLSCLVSMAWSQSVIGQVINIGPDENPITINELYEIIKVITGYSGHPTYMPDRPQEVKVAICSSNMARILLGYKTETDLCDGLVLMYGAMKTRGPRPFKYHLPIEIDSTLIPRTWKDRLF